MVLDDMIFATPKRKSDSDSTIFSEAAIPAIDKRYPATGELYSVQLSIAVNDPSEEMQIARTCVEALNDFTELRRTLQAAYEKLDSVAFLRVEGDTDAIKKRIRKLLFSGAR